MRLKPGDADKVPMRKRLTPMKERGGAVIGS